MPLAFFCLYGFLLERQHFDAVGHVQIGPSRPCLVPDRHRGVGQSAVELDCAPGGVLDAVSEIDRVHIDRVGGPEQDAPSAGPTPRQTPTGW